MYWMHLCVHTQVEEKYDVIGNMNEFQLTIGETTFGGVPQLTQGQVSCTTLEALSLSLSLSLSLYVYIHIYKHALG